jgi:hypothetical protein
MMTDRCASIVMVELVLSAMLGAYLAALPHRDCAAAGMPVTTGARTEFRWP